MNPGRACLACHAAVNADEGEEEAPGNVGGTVYPTRFEPDLCNGFGGGGATIVLTGSDGVELRLNVNAAGNFFAYTNRRVARPYRARLEYQGRVRQMQTPQMSADCNSCHTERGANGAPGRIYLP